MDTKQEKNAIELLATGAPQAEVAQAIGVSQSAISRFAKKNQETIQKESERLLEVLPSIIEQTIRDIKTSDELSKVLAEREPEELTNVKRDILILERDGLLKNMMMEAIHTLPEYIHLNFRRKILEDEYIAKFSPKLTEKMCIKLLELGYKKQSDILRALGILPATSQSIFIQNMIQKNTTNVLSPVVMQVLGEHLSKLTALPPDTDVIDVIPNK